MTNVPYKFKTSVSSSAITSEQLDLSFPEGKNAYRVKSIKIQIDDLDVEVANDLLFKLQLAYQNLNAGSDLTIDDKDEILTLSERLDQIGGAATTPAQIIADKLRDSGLLYLDGRDFNDVFIIKSRAWCNMSNSGQDAAEEFHVELKGQYVKLAKEVIDQIDKGVSLS